MIPSDPASPLHAAEDNSGGSQPSDGEKTFPPACALSGGVSIASSSPFLSPPACAVSGCVAGMPGAGEVRGKENFCAVNEVTEIESVQVVAAARSHGGASEGDSGRGGPGAGTGLRGLGEGKLQGGSSHSIRSAPQSRHLGVVDLAEEFDPAADTSDGMDCSDSDSDEEKEALQLTGLQKEIILKLNKSDGAVQAVLFKEGFT